MNEGWIKIWESTIYHHVWRDDPVAWRVFEYLLLTSYRGTPQGTTVKTTQQITDACFGSTGKNGTCYKAIKRLEKYEMVKTKSSNKRTEFKIVNWWKYQGTGSAGKNEVKTKSKHGNTLIRIKNKEQRNTNKSNDLVEIKKIYDLFIQDFEKNPNTYKLTDKRKTKIRQRLKDAGYEMLAKAVKNTAESEFHRGDNDRGWKADLDFITRSYEQVERLSELDKENKIVSERAAWFYDN
jgi:hypothetical protein